MKKLVALFLALVMVFSLAGCNEAGKAEEAVKNLFEAFKANDFEEAAKYIKNDDGAAVLDDEYADMLGHVFTKIDYSIVSSEKIDGETFAVTASVTAPDMGVAVADFFEKAIAFAFSNAFSETPVSDEESEEQMEKMFVEAVEKEGLGTVTNETVVTVVKAEDGWKVKGDEAFIDTITGGMMTAFDEVQNSLEDVE